MKRRILNAIIASMPLALSADDISIFSEHVINNQPNVTIIIDDSASMSQTAKTGNPRIDDAKNAATYLIDNLENVNVSLMSFINSSEQDATVDFASTDISIARQAAKKVITNYVADPGTTANLIQGVRRYSYYLSGQNANISSVTNSRVLDDSSIYYFISPITDKVCQTNKFVLITQGTPADEKRFNPSCAYDSRYPSNIKSCMHLMTEQIKNTEPKSTTHIVSGFDYDVASPFKGYLQNAAFRGGGSYYDVYSDMSQLAKDLSGPVGHPVSLKELFLTSPITSADPFNPNDTASDVYLSFFEGRAGPAWFGNLKRYRLGNDAKLYDTKGNLVINPATGDFYPTTQSFWGGVSDGASPLAGGVAQQREMIDRVYTNLSGDSNVDLNLPGNKVHENNLAITSTMLGANNTQDRSNLLKWARGDGTDDSPTSMTDTNRKTMGDILHSTPQVVTYFKDSTTSIADRTIFFAANDGFLYGVDTDNGKIEFSYIPKELLGILKKYREQIITTGFEKIYGLDGGITVWAHDSDGDGDILNSNNGTADSGDHVYLYIAMRRGGKNIYALDVTDRKKPKLKWIIKGNLSVSSEFGRLAQTWSTPKLATVKWQGSNRKVLIFGGGYNDIYDHASPIYPSFKLNSTDLGSAIFMVDAETGALLWKTADWGADLTLKDLKDNIAADVTLIDIDEDGITDFMYAIDINGAVFRFDFNKSNTSAANFATGGVIAKLNRTTRPNHFEPITVAKSSSGSHLNLAIGSGQRTNPLEESTTNFLYIIKDPNVHTKPSSYNYTGSSPIFLYNLVDVSKNLVQDGTSTQKTTALANLKSSHGWYFPLPLGEKVLSRPIIFEDTVIFTSFAKDLTIPACSVPVTSNYNYVFNIVDGSAVLNFDSTDSSLNKTDRRVKINKKGIAPPPTVITRNNKRGLCIKGKCLGHIKQPNVILRRYWRENQ